MNTRRELEDSMRGGGIKGKEKRYEKDGRKERRYIKYYNECNKGQYAI